MIRNAQLHKCALALVVGVALSSCMAQSFQVLKSGADAGGGGDGLRVTIIEDQATFSRVFGELFANQRPAPAAPAVDFTNDMVVLATLGERPTAGYGIKIESINCAQGTLKVKVLTISPPPHKLAAQVITSPFVLASTKRCPNLQNVEIVGPAGEFRQKASGR
jgi:hypothetical protein